MTKRYSWMLSVVLSGLAAFGSAAQASPNLVTNGGFETGTFDGWTGIGETDFNGVQCPGAGSGPYEGSCSAFFGPVLSTGGIEQSVNLGGAGMLWDLSFALQADGGLPSSFAVVFGGQTLLSLTDPAAGGNVLYHFSGVSTGGTMTLAFSFLDPVGFLSLDAVSVSAVTPVPEPATIGLMGTGLLGLMFWRRRKTG